MSTTPSRGHKYFLIIVNVFSRQVSAEALRSKEPLSVAPALRRLVEALPEKPQVLSTDDGAEFTRHVEGYLVSAGIAHKTRVAKQYVNTLAVEDRSLQNIKARMSRTMARSEKY